MPRNIDAIKQFAFWLKASKDKRLWSVVRQGAAAGYREDAIKRACKAFGLDAENSADRNTLLGIFADAHFPDTRPRMNALASRHTPKNRGPRVKWDAAKKKQFKIDILDVVDSWPDKSPFPSDEKIGELLKERFNTDDETRYIATPETLAKYFRQLLRGGNK
jgi:hypothetical protein